MAPAINENKKIRTYEISLWTLQDDFITVLKSATMENKGQIWEGKAHFGVDGLQELKFKIPMYIYENGERIENELYMSLCTHQHKQITPNLRKIKLIFNKAELDERTYEFLITKVTDEHDNDELYCNIECEGLAFNELGRIGYSISLNSEDFYEEYKQWALNSAGDEAAKASEPIANLQWWLGRFGNNLQPYPTDGSYINPGIWYYTIEMDWSSEMGGNQNLDSHTVYEAPYATSWDYTTNNIIPKKIQWVQEKARLVDLEQSNVYNLTQSLAEAFGIFCRYEYLHDANQHITGRKVIFYNNFFYEAAGNIDLNYPYGASYIAREVDSEHVVTKMFVKAVEDDSSYNNLISIMNTPANRSGEDYLLNFDYLHDIGTISEEQYARIAPYEKDMRFINDAMIPFESQLVEVESKLPEAEASLTIAENAIQLDNERLGAANDLLKKLTNDTGWIEVKESQPDTSILIKQKDDNSTDYGPYSVKLSKQGIDPGSIRVFRTYMIRTVEEPETEEESENDEETPKIQKNKYVGKLYDELFTGEIETDEFGDPIKINNLYTSSFNNSSTDTATLISSGSKLVYLTYRYDPKLYYDKVIATWQNRLAKDQSDKEKYDKEVKKLTALKEKLTEILDLLREEKKTRKERFERLMGPALREGSWEPEERNDCGEHHEDFFKIGYEDSVENSVSIENGTTGGFADKKDLFIWDTELFEGETSLTYELGVDQEVTSYKIIDISNAIAYWKDNFFDDLNDIFKSLCFRFQDISIEGLERSDILKYRNFSVGVSAELGFVKIEEEGKQVIKPVLILYETQDLKQEDLSNEAELGGITVSLATSKEKISIEVTDSTIDESGNIVKTPKTLTSYVQILKSEWTFPFNGITINENESNEKQYSGLNWLNAKYCKRVYPRIEIKSSTLKTSSDQLIVSYNQKELEAYTDYSILTRLPTGAQVLSSEDNKTPREIVDKILGIKSDNETENNESDESSELNENNNNEYNEVCYYITIKPEVLLQYGDLKILNILYNLSLTDLGIYLDAIQVLKENAYPKVSYSIKPNIVDERFIHKAYDMLAHIVNINDLDLHFKNVRGYISEVELDLDQPWNDDIVIKNYKNKFEDLFSTIIAETEEMKRAGNFFNLAGSAFTLNGSLEPYVLENSLRKVDLNYAFNHGKLIISEENGIWGLSEAGVVAFRGGGIFTSTRKDRAGNWIWNTGIVPQGINADLITTGQLDTNRVMVYAGDKLRFQLNGDGLFAYKSFFDDIGSIIEATSQNNSLEVGKVNTLIASQGDVDAAQFVRMYSEGLFLTVKERALVLNRDKSNYLTIESGNEYEIERSILRNPNIDSNAINEFNKDNLPEGAYYKRDNDDNIIVDKEGNPTTIVIKKKMNIPSEGLNRVEISWNGLIMRDWTNTPTFFADPDTGDLYLSGTIFAKDFYVIDDSYSSNYNPSTRVPFYNWMDLKFEDHVQVSKNLEDIFDKAGKILSKAGRSLNAISELTNENLSILSNFYQDIKADVTPGYAKGPYHTVHFKPGDVWSKTAIKGNDNSKWKNLDENGEALLENNPYANEKELIRYVATAYWDEVYDSEEKAQNGKDSISGWTRTYDASLAAIRGARVEYDAAAGTVTIEGENRVDIGSGGTLTLGADDQVDIYSNQVVNIGGKKIYIGAASISESTSEGTTTTTDTSGIYLVSSNVIVKSKDQNGELTGSHITNSVTKENATSKVFITPDGIDMTSKNGIDIASDSGITLYSSSDKEATAIEISRKNGIWMGSSQKISLFSSNTIDNMPNKYENQSTRDTYGTITNAGKKWIDDHAAGANVEISPNRIIFGLSQVTNSNSNATAVEMTTEYITLAAGSTTRSIEQAANATSNPKNPYDYLKANDITGVVIEKNAIGLATSKTTNNEIVRNLVLMDENGILIGNATKTSTDNNVITNPDITYTNSSSYNMGLKNENTSIPNTDIKFMEHSLDTEGSFISIQKDKLLIGSSGNFYLNATNILIDSAATDGTGYKGTIMRLGPITDPGLIFDGANLWIKGNIYAGGTNIYYYTPSTTPGGTGSWGHSTLDDYLLNETNARLSSAFNEAASIINDINNAFDTLDNISIENDNILNNFKTKIESRLKQTKTIGTTHPTIFKPGDIWEQTNSNNETIATYMAVCYSSAIDSTKITNTSLAGWNKISDGAIASTTGACMYSDAELGIISLWGSKGIHLYTAQPTYGDNISNTGLNNKGEIITGAALDLTQNGIYLAATKEIALGVTNVTTDSDTGEGTIGNSGFSGIRISEADGIWIGSNKELNFYSSSTTNKTRANLQMNSSHIIFGLDGNDGSTVVEMTTDRIIMGAKGSNNKSVLADETTFNPSIAGVRIKKDQIGLVTSTQIPLEGSNWTRNNVILMSDSGIVIGSNLKKEGPASDNINNYIQSGIVITHSEISAVAAQIFLGASNNNSIKLNREGISILSGETGLTLRNDEISMSTGGKVNLYGDNGVILFRGYEIDPNTGLPFASDEDVEDYYSNLPEPDYEKKTLKDVLNKTPNFRVDEEGNIYCNSITCRQGTTTTQESIPTQTDTTPDVTKVVINGENNYLHRFDATDSFSTTYSSPVSDSYKIEITKEGTYEIIIKLKKYDTHSGYFSSIKLEGLGETRSSSLAWEQGKPGEEKILQFSDQHLDAKKYYPQLKFKMATDQDYYLDLYKITIEVYGKNFKSGSTSTTVNAGWAGNKYTVARKSDSTIIASTSVSLSSDQITTTTPSSELILAEVSASESDSKYLPIKVESNESDINKKLSFSKYIKINKAASSTPNVSDVKVNDSSSTWTLYPGNTFGSGDDLPLQITINDSIKTLKLAENNKIKVIYPTLSMSATKNTTYTGNTFLNTITPSNSDQIFFVKTYEADDDEQKAKSSGYIKVKGITSIIPSSSLNQWNVSKDDNFNTKTITTGYKINDEATMTVTNKVLDYIVKTLMSLRENNSNLSPEYLTWISGEDNVRITLFTTDNHYITLTYDKEEAESFQKEFYLS